MTEGVSGARHRRGAPTGTDGTGLDGTGLHSTGLHSTVAAPTAPAAVILLDTAAGQVTYATPAARQITPGLELPAPVGAWALAAGLGDAHPEGLGPPAGPLERVATGGSQVSEVVTVRAPGHDGQAGRPHPLWMLGVPLTDATGLLAHQALVVLLPVRETARPGSADDRADDLALRAVAASGTSFAISDAVAPDKPLVWVNPAFERASGYSAAESVGRNCRFLQGPGTDRAAVARMREALDRGEAVEEVLLNYRADGTPFWNHLVVSPLLGAGGELTHFVGVQTDVTARVETDRERAAAHARADRALESERRARAEAEVAKEDALTAQHRLAVLARVGGALAATLDADGAAARLCELVVPSLADWAVITLADDERGRAVRGCHRDGRGSVLQWWGEQEPRLGARRARGPQGPRLVWDGGPLGEGAAAPPRLTDPPESVVSVMVVPLEARRRRLGSLTMGTGASQRRFDGGDLAIAAELGTRLALALDNARLYAAEHATAIALQRSLLPVLPVVPGIDVAAVYLPGNDRAEVGGDWYDVLDLPDGATGLAVGDVMGHDLAAAASMGQLRSVLRTCAWEGDRPGRVLDRLDRLVQGLGMADLATCVYARLDAALVPGGDRTLTWANAGHHPPLVRTPDGEVHSLDDGASVVIGVDPADAGAEGRAEARRPVPPGSVLLFFTDGLIENRDQDLEVGLAAVRGVLAAHDPAQGPDALTGALTHRLLASGQDDDVCLLAVHVR